MLPLVQRPPGVAPLDVAMASHAVRGAANGEQTIVKPKDGPTRLDEVRFCVDYPSDDCFR